MVNKKGYIKILEAILSIIIVLSFILFIAPKKDINKIKVDPELESTVDSIAKHIENNANVRACATKTDNREVTDCIGQVIPNLKPQGATWKYAVRSCTGILNNDGSLNINLDVCGYKFDNQQLTNELTNEAEYKNKLNTIKTDVFTRNFILTVPDITETGTTEPLTPIDQSRQQKLIRLLFWSEQ